MKLDELIRTSAARDTYIGIERLSQAEVEKFRALCAAATPSPLPSPTAETEASAPT
jgi:low affinity Fe/Cu permease